jgi:hypothetical protein
MPVQGTSTLSRRAEGQTGDPGRAKRPPNRIIEPNPHGSEGLSLLRQGDGGAFLLMRPAAVK